MAATGPGDPELDAFVERYVVSFAAWDLLVLLHAHPALKETAKGLAYRLGRSEPDVAASLESLRAGGIVGAEGSGDAEVFGLVASAEPLLARFAAASADRDWRFELVRKVLVRIGTP